MMYLPSFSFFFFNDTATTEIYTLSLHDALPIYLSTATDPSWYSDMSTRTIFFSSPNRRWRSEEHTSELQSRENLVCRLLLEKKKSGGRRPRCRSRCCYISRT